MTVQSFRSLIFDCKRPIACQLLYEPRKRLPSRTSTKSTVLSSISRVINNPRVNFSTGRLPGLYLSFLGRADELSAVVAARDALIVSRACSFSHLIRQLAFT